MGKNNRRPPHLQAVPPAPRPAAQLIITASWTPAYDREVRRAWRQARQTCP